MAETIVQNQATNLEILKRLQVLAETERKPEAAEWIPVSFKLTQETLDGPPAVDYEVSLGSGAEGYNLRGAMERVSDSNGLADFGVIRPGDWAFQVRKSSDEEGHYWETIGTLNVLPGSKISRSIVCPKAPSDDVPVRVLVDWPADLSNKDLRLALLFVHEDLSFQSAVKWSYRSDGFIGPVSENLVYGPEGAAVRVTVDDFSLWRSASLKDPNRLIAALSRKNVAPAVEKTMVLATGAYRLRRLMIMRPYAIPGAPERGEQFEVLAFSCASKDSLPVIYRVIQPPAGDDEPTINPFSAESGVSGIAIRTYWQRPETRFEIVAGRTKEWNIPIPEELAQAVRHCPQSRRAIQGQARGEGRCNQGRRITFWPSLNVDPPLD